MRHVLTIYSFLFLSLLGLSQSDVPLEQMIQQLLDHPKVEIALNLEKPNRLPLVIRDNGVLLNTFILNKFGQPVKFCTDEQIFFFNHEAVLHFTDLSTNKKVVETEFLYRAENIRFSVKWKNKNHVWLLNRVRVSKM